MSVCTRTTSALLLAAAFSGTPAMMQAQQDTTVRIDARWRAYVGCWATFRYGARGADACLVPTADSTTVELVAIAGDSILTRTRISTAGTRVPQVRGGCTGWESGSWSIDERRVYTRAEYDCGSKGMKSWTGIIAMSRMNRFTRIEGGASRRQVPPRALYFHQLAFDSAAVPLEIRRRLPPWDAPATWVARGAQSADVSAADVADAARAVDAPVVEEWLIDRNQAFPLSRDDRRAMHDASVPDNVVSVMAAVSHPEKFYISDGAVRKVATHSRMPAPRTGPAYTIEASPFGRGKPGRPTLSPLSSPLDETALPPFPYRNANDPGIWVIPPQ